MDIKKIISKPAKCSLDLGDGSERGLYVNQDYIISKLKRTHRAISLMYTYYPNDKTWPLRANKAFPKNKNGAWDYPYENYFPYRGGREHLINEEPFNFMKEIRMHGQDVMLTLTADPMLKKDDLILLANDLRPYGNIYLRLNHECTGNWFCYTKRASYQQIADFFVLACKVFHEYAPNVKMILCAGMYLEETGKLEMEDIFLEAHKAADIWSGDQYLSLHWGWPNDIANKETKNYACYNVDDVYEKAKKTYLRLCKITNQNKPMVLSELNADGDVTGPFEQSQMMKHFMKLIKKEKNPWLSAFTFYQFRDDGRLGLEITDPNNNNVGIEQPILNMYKNELQNKFFSTNYSFLENTILPVKLRWGSSDDSEGIEIDIKIKRNPNYFELYFPDELKEMNLLIQFENYSFYKAPGISYLDLISYFFENKIKHPCIKKLRIFCPPQNGLNKINNDNDENLFNDYTVISKLPIVRLEYSPVSLNKKYRD